MPKGRFFAQPDDLVRIDFEDGPLAGEWIQVRAALSFVEIQEIAAGAVGGMYDEAKADGGSRRIINLEADKFEPGQIRKWVKRWSLEGGDRGQRPSDDGLRMLLEPDARQILRAIADHEEALAAEAEIALDPKPEASSTSTTEPPTGDSAS